MSFRLQTRNIDGADEESGNGYSVEVGQNGLRSALAVGLVVRTGAQSGGSGASGQSAGPLVVHALVVIALIDGLA